MNTQAKGPGAIVLQPATGDPVVDGQLPAAWAETATIGSPPEHRDYRLGDEVYWPEVGHSSRINAFVTIDCGIDGPTVIGERCFLLAHSHVGHDARLGDNVELSTGAIVGGYAEVGDDVRIGLNAVIMPGRKVGDGAIIGAGAVVTHNVPAGEAWAGVPARAL